MQENPNEHLDLWAREHYKSTIITFGLTIMGILQSHGENPVVEKELSFGIFSHTRPQAKTFLRQIKREFETNEQLKWWFSDILYDNPQKESPKWSEDDGLVVKRKSNRKESTLAASGLVDGQPTGMHYDVLVYDDIVTLQSVTSPDMIEKTTEALEMSYNLGVSDGGSRRMIGTRYHYNDTYRTVLNRGTFRPRIYPATIDGSVDGEAVLLTSEKLSQKRRDMGSYTFSSQMLQNPLADEAQNFKREWVKFYENVGEASNMNKYLIVDPANEKKKDSDYSAFWVIGLGADNNYYVLDIIRDRMNLTERAEMFFHLHRKWKPLRVGYEKYGMQADVQHIKAEMGRKNYHVEITELGGAMPKRDRIRRLIPLFEQGRVYFPITCFKTDYMKQTRDLVQIFIDEEYLAFPVGLHDDMLDALARITDEDMMVIWPKLKPPPDKYADRYGSKRGRGTAWGN